MLQLLNEFLQIGGVKQVPPAEFDVGQFPVPN